MVIDDDHIGVLDFAAGFEKVALFVVGTFDVGTGVGFCINLAPLIS